MTTTMTTSDRAALRRAKKMLDTPGLAARLTGAMSIPVAKGLALVPAPCLRLVGRITQAAVQRALAAAAKTLRTRHRQPAASGRHTLAVVLGGAVSGAFGLPALALELPLSTTVMLRSIAAIARSEGHDPRDPRVRLECVQVFALGGPAPPTAAAETGYFAVRAALARSVAEAARHMARQTVGTQGAPALVRFITQVTARFGLVVSDKVVAQAIPLIGAVGGGFVNFLFIRQFQRTARGHFIIRRLEARYGEAEVQREYERGG
ncbi:MAG: EcsC family protein [Desulfobacterales bacterium]|nr:EcsC family protein [Desulfobacterales bacterium]